jgi:hypothetical protein
MVVGLMLQSRLRVALVAAALLAAGGCVESYGGSDLQIDFGGSVEVPSGTTADGTDVPADTYFTFYATDEIEDEDGNVVSNAVFAVQAFEIKPVVNQSSPCFIDLDDAEFPGLHVTQFALRKRQKICDRLGLDEHCIDDPFAAPSGATDGDVSDVLGADIRMDHLPLYQSALKAVATFSNFQYPAALADCDFTGDQLPSPSCIDDASNAQRLRVCQALWADNLDLYEGSDKVFTLPLNGQLRGLVSGNNPVNGGPVGGSQFLVDSTLVDFESYSINWQWKDHDGDGDPDYPADFLVDHEPSDIGYQFMTGRPESRTRGVINSRMTNPFDPNVAAEVAIFADIGEDDLHF